MRINKFAGKVYGADLTAAERKAMNMEIQRQLEEYTEQHRLELDAMILWVLHSQYGWGEKRLRRFYDLFEKELDELLKYYELGAEDRAWLCTYLLKKDGIDVKKWSCEKGLRGVEHCLEH